jgi:hypothetical protein
MSCSQYNRPRKANYMDWYTEVGRSVQSDHNTQGCDKQLWSKRGATSLQCDLSRTAVMLMENEGFWVLMCITVDGTPKDFLGFLECLLFYVQVWCGVTWWCGSWCEDANHFSTFLSSQSLPDIEGCLSCSLEMVVSLSVCIHEGWLSVCESHPEIL